MRIAHRTSLAFAVLLACVPVSQVESQGIGGLIKKKAVEAAKGKDAKKDVAKNDSKDDPPTTSKFDKDCGPVTPESVDNFLKGLQAEIAAREAFDKRAAQTKPAAEVRACRDKNSIGEEGRSILNRGLENGGTPEFVMKQLETNKANFETFLAKRCGESDEKWDRSAKIAAYTDAHASGAKAAGVTEHCYDKLKEFATAFCKGLTPEQQKLAAEQGIKVPGSGTDVFWVFTADEAKAFMPRCSELTRAMKGTEPL